MSGRPSPLRSPTFTPAEVSPFSSKSNTRSNERKTSPAGVGAWRLQPAVRTKASAQAANRAHAVLQLLSHINLPHRLWYAIGQSLCGASASLATLSLNSCEQLSTAL